MSRTWDGFNEEFVCLTHFTTEKFNHPKFDRSRWSPTISPSLQPSKNSSQIFIAISNNQNCSNIDSKSIYYSIIMSNESSEKMSQAKVRKPFSMSAPIVEPARVKFRFIFVFKRKQCKRIYVMNMKQVAKIVIHTPSLWYEFFLMNSQIPPKPFRLFLIQTLEKKLRKKHEFLDIFFFLLCFRILKFSLNIF